MQRDAADPRNQTVREHRRYLACDHLVFPIFAPTGDDVITLIEFVEETRDVCRIVLEISIHRNQNFSLRRIDTGGHRCCLAVVSPQRNHTYTWVELSNLAQDLQAAVTGTIVYVNDFRRTAE